MILKIITVWIPAKSNCTKAKENETDINSNSVKNGIKINEEIPNLSSNTKKISSKKDFFISKTSLAFVQLGKIFTKALIL